MLNVLESCRHSVPLFLLVSGLLLPLHARAASCTSQSQMTPAQRDDLSSIARTLVSQIERGDLAALRDNTTPAVAADFSGIADTVERLKPLLQGAAVTVEELLMLDASSETPGAARADFYCGSPVVVLNFTDMTPGVYAVAVVHATGVPNPQQISLIFAKAPDGRWMLGGFVAKPMMAAGHDGLWYWTSARGFAAKNMNWDAWLYYRTANALLRPADFLSSPNLEKLEHEQEHVRPENLPVTKPIEIDAHGSAFQLTGIDSTTEFGRLDLEVQYAPDIVQSAQLRDPPSARKQVVEVMSSLLALHPELAQAYEGIWVRAEDNAVSLFSLELPMNQILPGQQLSIPPVR